MPADRKLMEFFFKDRSENLGVDVQYQPMYWVFDLFHPSAENLNHVCKNLVAEFDCGVSGPKWNRDPDYEEEGWVCKVAFIRQFSVKSLMDFEGSLGSLLSPGGEVMGTELNAIPKRPLSSKDWESRWDRKLAKELEKLNAPEPIIETPALNNFKFSSGERESPWLELCSFELKGKSVFLTDMRPGPTEDGVNIPLKPGIYRVELRLLKEKGEVINSAMRITPAGGNPEKGALLGEISTDLATVGLYDEKRLKACFRHDQESLFLWGEGAMNRPFPGKAPNGVETPKFEDLPYGVLIYDLKRNLILPFAKSGRGDGTFPVFELLEGDERVGFVVQFQG